MLFMAAPWNGNEEKSAGTTCALHEAKIER